MWETSLKITPYYVKKGSAFSLKEVSEITCMNYADESERRDLVVMNWTCYTEMRVQDIHSAKSNNFTNNPADQAHPRNIVAVLNQTKNAKNGIGPASGRTFLLPCICMPTNSADKKKWCKTLLENPDAKCLDPCPYMLISEYLNDCPLPEKVDDPPLSFIRALSTRGEPYRTVTVPRALG